MASIFDGYKKTKTYLVCIDSDGCVMDTMNVKHIRVFGPKMIEEWNLQQWEDDILTLWNKFNLFSSTRGINRFQGLSLLFEHLADMGIEIPYRQDLKDWCAKTSSLSNDALQKAIDETQSPCLVKALAWSKQVNESIALLPKVDCVFQYARETMDFLHQAADIAIVSSANKEAVWEEWTRLDCLPYVHIVCGQDAGTKSHCIHELKQYYEQDHVLMIGDALSDLQAAKENEVYFYPILAGKEAASWLKLKQEAGTRFLSQTYDDAYAQELEQAMKDNLK